MKRLIWKEWREKRRWLLVFVAVIVAVLLVGHTGFSYGGSHMSPWTYAIVFPALLLGLSTFSREMGYECQDFIFSRAIGWKKILGAKILADIIIMLLAIVVGAIVFWFIAPSDYMSFLGFGRVLFGIGIVFGVALVGYLPGFGASSVLPGMLGSGFVLCLTTFAIGIEAAFLSNFPFREPAYFGLILSWILAIVITSVIMTRQGLTLTARDRTKKYMMYVSIISTLMILWIVPLANQIGEAIRVKESNYADLLETDISPDGQYMLVRSSQHPVPGENISLFRRSDGKSIKLPYNGLPITGITKAYDWCGPDTLLVFPETDPNAWQSFTKLRMDKSGKIARESTAPLPMVESFKVQLSPSKRYAAVSGRSHRSRMGRSYPMRYNNKYLAVADQKQEQNPDDDMKLCIVDLNEMKSVYVTSFGKYRLGQFRWEAENLLVAQAIFGHLKNRSQYHAVFHITPDGKVTMEKTR